METPIYNQPEGQPIYGVFIIESMDIENECDGKLDGFTLKTMLDLCGIPCEYYYIRTVLELEEIIKIYIESKFGFLHIACHGDESQLGLTFENIDFAELERIVGESLFHRRLFLSACKAARFDLAQRFIPKYHCYSVVGTPDDIDYDKAAVFWSSFYYLIYGVNRNAMPQADLMPVLEKVTSLFELRVNYYSIINNRNPEAKTHLREACFEPGSSTRISVLKTDYINIYRG